MGAVYTCYCIVAVDGQKTYERRPANSRFSKGKQKHYNNNSSERSMNVDKKSA